MGERVRSHPLPLLQQLKHLVEEVIAILYWLMKPWEWGSHQIQDLFKGLAVENTSQMHVPIFLS